MTMRPNTNQILAHTHTPNFHSKLNDALLSIDYVGADILLTFSVDNQTHAIHKTMLKNPQDLFTWGSINTKDNLKGHQLPLYRASQLNLEGHQQTPIVIDLQQYKYWVVLEGEALITIGNQQQLLASEQAVLLPPMNQCQLTNLLATELVMLQVQCRHGFNPNQAVNFEFHH